MAEGFVNATPHILPQDIEVQQFAKELYNYLWIRFKVVVPGRVQRRPSHVNPIFTEAIGIAVLCEQLLMRRVVLQEVFVPWSLVIARDPNSAHAFCQALYKNGCTWSYCKRFFRCCAVISEFFLFRSKLLDDNQLSRAELVFKVVFDDFFRTVLGDCGGWRGLDKYARERINPIYNRFEAYVDNLTDPLDYFPPEVERLPDAYEVEFRFNILHAQNYDLQSEISTAFSGLVDIFAARNARASEEAANQLMGISLSEDENSLPKFEPIERKYQNAGAASSAITNPLLKDIDKATMFSDMALNIPTKDRSTKKPLRTIKPKQLPRFVSTVPFSGFSTFSPITKGMPSSTQPRASGSTPPMYKPKPQKSFDGSSSEIVKDDTSITAGLKRDAFGLVIKPQLHKPSGGSQKMAGSSSVPTEKLPYSSRKRTMSSESSDEDDGLKKTKK